MTHAIGIEQLAFLNDQYACSIDEDRLEEWPALFSERCLYKITNADNHRRGYEAGLIYADTRGMLFDRVASLRKANVYERHRYRHIIGTPVILECDDNQVTSKSTFLVVRIMRDGGLTVFATGIYIDRVIADAEEIRFYQRVVVCDGSNIDTLLAIPL